MAKTYDLAGRVRKLALAADKQGLRVFEMHEMVKAAFRDLHESQMRKLDERLEQELGREVNIDQPSAQFDVQDIGGEIMSKPLKEYASGSVQAAIWENEHQKDNRKFTTQTVRVERRYKNENGDWQGTNGFRKNDLPHLELTVRKAFEFLSVRERQPRDEKSSASSEA